MCLLDITSYIDKCNLGARHENFACISTRYWCIYFISIAFYSCACIWRYVWFCQDLLQGFDFQFGLQSILYFVSSLTSFWRSIAEATAHGPIDSSSLLSVNTNHFYISWLLWLVHSILRSLGPFCSEKKASFTCAQQNTAGFFSKLNKYQNQCYC